MPKVPGRESTRKTYDVDDLLVASFVMMHEEWLWRQPCSVKDCDHRLGPKTDEPGWVHWKSCDENQIPAAVVLADNIEQRAGFACAHHVADILNRE